MALVRKISKPRRRDGRWHSQAHLTHVRKHACVACDGEERIEAAHVRLGSHTGMSITPHDWLAVPLCHQCHRGGVRAQHNIGEATFWAKIGKDPQAVMDELVKSSPKKTEIMQERASRG